MNLRQAIGSLAKGAAPPFISQIAFSVVSFFSIAGVSRNSTEKELAAIIAAYSLESISVSYGNARWASLIVFRDQDPPRRGDIAVMVRAFLGILLVSLPVMFLGAYLVGHQLPVALSATAWSAAMLITDLMRYAGSRFLGSVQVSVVALAHVVLAVAASFVHMHSLHAYLAGLSALALLAALAYLAALLRGRPEGRSPVWTDHREFGRSMGVEAVLTSAATGVGGAAISSLNPALAVGLQLGNQVLGMPATVITQSLALPLTRRLGAAMDRGRYPTPVVMTWAGCAAAIPLVGYGLLHLLKPFIYSFLGAQAGYAYYFLIVVLLQTLALQPWQPFTWARRWTHGADLPRRHVVITVALFYAAVVIMSVTIHAQADLRRGLVVAALIMLISTCARSALWWRESHDWTPPRRAL